MAAAERLAAGWAVQAAASCPVTPPTAPVITAMSRSISAAPAARVTVAALRAAAGSVIRAPLSGVAGGGGLDVPDGPAGASGGEGDRPAGGGPAGAAAAGDDLADGDGDGDRAGSQVPDRQRGHDGGGCLVAGGALGQDAAGARGLGEDGFERGGGH